MTGPVIPDDTMSQAAAQLLTSYGLPGLVIMGLLWFIKWQMDDRKDMMVAHKAEIAVERANTAAERANVEKLQAELLAEARTNGDLAQSVEKAMRAMAGPPKRLPSLAKEHG